MSMNRINRNVVELENPIEKRKPRNSFFDKSLSVDDMKENVIRGFKLGLEHGYIDVPEGCDFSSESFHLGYIKGANCNIGIQYIKTFGSQYPNKVIDSLCSTLKEMEVANVFFEDQGDVSNLDILASISECSLLIDDEDFKDDMLVQATAELSREQLSTISLVLEHYFLNWS